MGIGGWGAAARDDGQDWHGGGAPASSRIMGSGMNGMGGVSMGMGGPPPNRQHPSASMSAHAPAPAPGDFCPQFVASRLALLLSALLPLLLLLHPLANNTKRGVTNKTLIQEWLVLRTSTQT